MIRSLGPKTADQTWAKVESAVPGCKQGTFLRQKLRGVDLLDECAGSVDFSSSGNDAGKHGGLTLMPAVLRQRNEQAGGIAMATELVQSESFKEAEINVVGVIWRRLRTMASRLSTFCPLRRLR